VEAGTAHEKNFNNAGRAKIDRTIMVIPMNTVRASCPSPTVLRAAK